MDENLKKLVKLISEAEKTVAIGHFNPDGDSVGSLTAFHSFLRQCGKDSEMILPNDYPSFLNFLDSERKILVHKRKKRVAEKAISESDLIVCLDFNKFDRTEKLAGCIKEFKGPKILIDHHPEPDKDAFDLVFSDTSMSSTCELLFWILMKIPPIDGDVSRMELKCAQSLGTGMLTDTNNFNNSVIPSTFEMASLLLKRGVDFESISRTVFSAFSQNRMRLMGHLLADVMVVDIDTKSAYMILSKEIQKKFGFQIGDSEGFVNLPMQIEGVEISALFIENDENIRVSLRSKGDISVNKFSNMFFNGGGHERAAGGRLKMPVSQIPEYFITSLKEFLDTKA